MLFLCSLLSIKIMHISIADDTKKRFHAACAIRGLKMSQVITELVEQWLETNNISVSSAEESEFVTTGTVTK
jgi:antitoxin component of RelBE/YafQ-DinJ toxin-antitoxin module